MVDLKSVHWKIRYVHFLEATTTTRPKGLKACASACIPGAKTPSSLEINIFTEKPR